MVAGGIWTGDILANLAKNYHGIIVLQHPIRVLKHADVLKAHTEAFSTYARERFQRTHISHPAYKTRWDEVLLSMSKIPSDDILESLYKLIIRESDQLKTVLELYDMEIHQKISMPN